MAQTEKSDTTQKPNRHIICYTARDVSPNQYRMGATWQGQDDPSQAIRGTLAEAQAALAKRIARDAAPVGPHPECERWPVVIDPLAIKAEIPARSPCPRHIVTSSQRPWTYERTHVVASKPAPFWTEIPLGLLDPVAAQLLPVLNNAGLRLWGRSAEGQTGELFVPIWYTDSDQTVAQWINQHIADWRDGNKRRPPLIAITAWWSWDGKLEIPLA